MPKKEAILENVALYNAEELAGYIRQGIVTFEELCEDTDGQFSAAQRKAVKNKIEGSDDSAWQQAQEAGTLEAVQHYLDSYPMGAHRPEATELKHKLQAPPQPQLAPVDIPETFVFGTPIEALLLKIKEIPTYRGKEYDGSLVTNADDRILQEIQTYIGSGRVKKEELAELLRNDHNLLSSKVIRSLLDNHILTQSDFQEVSQQFIRYLYLNKHPQTFTTPEVLDQIHKVPSTEVYFWGIPSSGKSCALGSILSVANDGETAETMDKDNDCQGYGYMTKLALLFNTQGQVSTLPEGTPTCSTYEMAFDLYKDSRRYPFTFVDLAGELVRCMYKSDAGEPMQPEEQEALDTLTNILIDSRTENRKIHFFVLEYGAEDRTYEGLPQSVYLEAALAYIKRTNIFKDATDAVYLILTKVDKVKKSGTSLQQELTQYIQQNYGGFYNGLKQICRANYINDGVVDILPFSLGQVCFQDYCLFDPRPARKVLQKLMTDAYGARTGKIGRIFKALRG